MFQYFDAFLSYLQLERRYSEHTCQAYQRDLNQFFSYGISRKWSGEHLSQKNGQEFLVYLGKQGYADATLRRKVAALRSFFTFLLRENHITVNPFNTLLLPKKKHVLPRVLSRKEMHAFLDGVSTETPLGIRNRSIFELLYSSGIRLSELVSLNVMDIQHVDQSILITGKGGHQRMALFGDTAAVWLSRYLKFCRETWVAPQCQALYINQSGLRLSGRSIQRILRDCCKEQGLDTDITPHTFRHSFATELLNGGADLRSIQELLGHESILSTQLYTHLNEKKLLTTFRQAHPRGTVQE